MLALLSGFLLGAWDDPAVSVESEAVSGRRPPVMNVVSTRGMVAAGRDGRLSPGDAEIRRRDAAEGRVSEPETGLLLIKG